MSPFSKTPAPQSGKTPAQQVEEGRKRLEVIATRRTRAQAIAETEKARLEQAKTEAKVAFGTSDLVELRNIRTSMNLLNEQKAHEFSAALDAAEEQLALVEQQLG